MKENNIIKNLLDKTFPKKFKVRLRLFGSSKTKYCIEYSHTRLFPDWKQLEKWLTRIGCWNPVLEKYPEAKQVAQTITSIDDVEKWYKKQEKISGEPFSKPEIEYIYGNKR